MTFLYLGCNGFPFGMAQVERQKLLAKSLIKLENKVIVVNRMGNHSSIRRDIEASGSYENIHYVYLSGSPYKEQNSLKRYLLRIITYLKEILYFLKVKRLHGIDCAIISTMSFSTLLYYYLLAKVYRFKIILDYVELNSAITTPENGKMPFDFWLFENYGAKFPHYFICITELLSKFVRGKNNDARIIRVPSLCDYEMINSIIPENRAEDYFLFCGSAIYLEVIEFVIESFTISDNGNFCLYLIVNGNKERLNRLDKLIKNSIKSKYIKVYSNLSYEDLIKFYKNAYSLLIPLRPTLQDSARFPHKIAEYAASGRPIITTKHEELSNYFIDMESALIVNTYNSSDYAEKMNFVILNPDIANKIGLVGKEVCRRELDYRIYGNKILTLIQDQ